MAAGQPKRREARSIFLVLVAIAMQVAWRGSEAMAAAPVKEVTSAAGVRAWLVEDHSAPLFAIHFAFMGGSAREPAGKEGLASLLASMLLEGAGADAAAAFKERLAASGIRMSFTASRDAIIGTLEGLTKRRAEAVALLEAVIGEPRLDAAALDQIRTRTLAELAFADRHPRSIALNDWYARAFAGHPYGRRAEGTPESIARITRDDLDGFRRQLFSRASLRVVAVGDIDEASLVALLDRVFAGLPVELAMAPPRTAPLRTDAGLAVIDRDLPSALTIFGLQGVPASHPDYFAKLVMCQILGSGQFGSRLLDAVRVERGLAYSVSMAPVDDGYASLLLGEVETANDNAAAALEVIRATLAGLAAEGPTEDEVARAKRYLIGSLPLGLDTSTRIAETLLAARLAGHGPDYVQERQRAIAAVTRQDVARIAARLLQPDRMIATIVGRAVGSR